MRRVIIPMVLFLAAACGPPDPALSDADVTALQNLKASYTRAVLAKDADAAAALYAEEAVLMPPNMPVTVGREAIREWFTAAFASGAEVSDFALTPVEVYGVDDLAYDRGTYSETAIVPDSPEPVVDTGKYMVIARRQEDGSWLWTVDMWSSDLPPQQPQ